MNCGEPGLPGDVAWREISWDAEWPIIIRTVMSDLSLGQFCAVIPLPHPKPSVKMCNTLPVLLFGVLWGNNENIEDEFPVI